ncbi:MAG: DUF3592 domain-containing protein [Paracoccaceae bacterium]
MKLLDDEGNELSPTAMYGQARLYFTFSALVAAFGFALIAWNYVSIQLSENTAIGTVISTGEYQGSRTGAATATVYQPTFNFIDSNGDERHQTTRNQSSTYELTVGDKVKISYDMYRDDSVSILDWSANLKIPFIAFAISALIGLWAFNIYKTGKQQEMDAR